MLVLFFLLLSGEMFLRRLVEVLPRFKNKRQAVEISQQIESDISAYLTTITVMNVAVGVATGRSCRLRAGDPVLWGTVAFLLNYVPILGPMSASWSFSSPVSCRSTPCGRRFCRRGSICHSPDRGRDRDTDAARPPVHHQPGARHRLAGVLVLDVGRARRDPLHADARDYQDRLRPHPPFDGVCYFYMEG